MSMFRVIGFSACFMLVGCSEDNGSNGTTTSETCTTVWDCKNNECACADGTSCEDEKDCDAVCEVCE